MNISFWAGTLLGSLATFLNLALVNHLHERRKRQTGGVPSRMTLPDLSAIEWIAIENAARAYADTPIDPDTYAPALPWQHLKHAQRSDAVERMKNAIMTYNRTKYAEYGLRAGLRK